MIYIDFDGVILDTEGLLLSDWKKFPNYYKSNGIDLVKYLENANWNYIINNSNVINDSIYYLKNIDPKTSFILTKVRSTDNEGRAKVLWLRNNGVKQSVIMVPYSLNKCDIVDANNNILIDDSLRNLRSWQMNNGYPILFDKNNDNIDSWGEENKEGYKKVLDLSICLRSR